MDSAVLHQNSGKIAAALVQGALNDGAASHLARVGLEFQEVCLKEHFLKELVYIESLLGRYFLALVLAAPVFHKDVHLRELAADGIRIGAGLVYLVDCKDHGDACRLCVGDGFLGLGHHGVIGRYNDNGKVRHLGAACTHGGEGLVAGGVQEGDAAAVLQFHAVCADVLGDTAGLTGNDVGVADVVKETGLTVVYVAHDGNHGRTLHKVFLAVGLLLLDFLGEFGGYEFHLIAEFFGHKDQGFGIQALVDGHHHAKGHAGADNLHHGGVPHEGGEVVDRHELRDFQHLVLCCCGLHLFLGADGCNLPLLLAVLCAEVVLGALVHAGVCLLHLLLDLLLHLFLLFGSHCRLEAVFLAALSASLCLGCGSALLGTVVLLGGFFGLHLGDVHFLGTAAFDALAFLAFLGVELGEVYLAHHFERCAACRRCLRWGRGGGFFFGFGLGFCNGFRLRLCHGLGFRFGLNHGFGFRLHYGFGLRLNHGLGFRLFLCGTRFLNFARNDRRRLLGLIRFCHRLRFAGEVVALDDGNSFGLVVVLFLRTFLCGLVKDFRELYVHFFGGFLEFKVLAEFLVKFREEFVRDLHVRVGILDGGSLRVEEVHKGVKSDVELLDKFR